MKPKQPIEGEIVEGEIVELEPVTLPASAAVRPPLPAPRSPAEWLADTIAFLGCAAAGAADEPHKLQAARHAAREVVRVVTTARDARRRR